MPTLPGRATSILAVLRGFSPVNRRASPQFDWPALVADEQPGNATEAQRRQAQRLAWVIEDIAPWLRQWGLSSEHREESALYATVTTPADLPREAVLAVAQTIAWIYAIDDFIDRPSSGLHDRDRDLAAIFAPLAPLTPRALRRAPWAQSHGTGAPVTSPATLPLHDSLAALFAALPTQWPQAGPRSGAVFRVRLAAEQMIACVAMMCRERGWSDEAAAHPAALGLPSAATYLAVGTISIGMPAVAAAVAGFEPRPMRAWRVARRAIGAAGSIVRLTNDLNTYEADVEEGKVSAVSIRLRDLGYAPFGHDPRASQEVRRAQQLVTADLAQAIKAFAHLQAALPVGSLSYYLRRSVAFALAVYGDGSRYAATAPAS